MRPGGASSAMNPHDQDDAALVRGCLAGEAAAWRTLVRRYQSLVYAVGRRARLDEHSAGDVLQTVFLRLHENLARIRDPERLHAWIVTTAKREALLALRQASRHVSLDDLRSVDNDGDEASPGWDPPSEDPLPEALLDELQQHHRLRSALDRLDERCRQLLLALFAPDDERLPYAALADRLGVPSGSLGPTRQRCLAKLRALMA